MYNISIVISVKSRVYKIKVAVIRIGQPHGIAQQWMHAYGIYEYVADPYGTNTYVTD